MPRRRRKLRWPAINWRKIWRDKILWQRLGKFLALALIWGGVLLTAALIYFSYDLPDISTLEGPSRRPSINVQATDGSLIARFGENFGARVRVAELPQHVPQAVLAIEDRRFYQHGGVDAVGIARAVFANMRAGRLVQGGSTLTQQLVKNLFLTPDRTLRRKVQELLLALWLEANFSKEQILNAYLNRVYLGAGSYGFDAAAIAYFGKTANDLAVEEAAVLAGLLKAPSRFAPTNDAAAAKNRAAVVLKAMLEAGYLTPSAYALAEQGLAKLQFQKQAVDGRYFAAWVANAAQGLAGNLATDIVVTTTLDLDLQRAAERALTRLLDKEGSKNSVGQGALLLLGNDGAVRAYVGGRDYDDSEFDRVTQAMRQPGSAFKPFVYLAALASGLGSRDLFVDRVQSFGNYQPQNYDGKYLGEVDATTALARSLNTVAVQVANRVGIPEVMQTARALGITSALTRDLSLALGTSEVSLHDLTAAYAGIAAGGRLIAPFGIVEIVSRDGQVLYRQRAPMPRQVVSPRAVAALVPMLEEVVVSGTGRRADIGRPQAGKTGTTQDYRDAWFVGFTGHYTLGVWLGNDNNSRMKRITGGSLPAALWAEVMRVAEARLAPAALGPLQDFEGVDDFRAPDAPPSHAINPDEIGDFLKNLLR
jgi:penicillin-binding protein 1A